MSDPIELPRLSLGPVPYFWSRDDLLAFYDEAAGMPVDVVYLGETVCSKRRSLNTDDWIGIAEKLDDAGKEVVLSTLALLEAESELKTLRRICGNGRFAVEANDLGAVHLLSGKTAFVTGPSVNIYNPGTLHMLARVGLKRWVFPVELSRESLVDLQTQRPEGMETEVFAFGRLPLAYSARCFTARAHNLPKDDCQYRCLDYPEGMSLASQDHQVFLNLNGIQTQSAQTCNLLAELEDMQSIGVDVIRISPQYRNTGKIAALFASVLRKEKTGAEAAELANRFIAVGPCDGYWHGRPGRDLVAAAALSE